MRSQSKTHNNKIITELEASFNLSDRKKSKEILTKRNFIHNTITKTNNESGKIVYLLK